MTKNPSFLRSASQGRSSSQSRAQPAQGVAGSYISYPGQVHQILDENFGLIKIDQGLVLFDTCDLWISPNTTASKATKTLGQVLKLGDEVLTHACLVDGKFKVAHLATAVWAQANPNFNNPRNYPPPVSRENIHAEKIDIYSKVVSSINDSIEAVGIDDFIINPKHVVTWQKAVVKAVFSDHDCKSHGNLVAGLVELPGVGSKDVAFFMSSNFAKYDAVPRIGMEEYANIYPVRQMVEPHKYGEITFICTNLYSPQMKGSCTIPNATRLKEILEESSELLLSLLAHYPRMNNPIQFIR